MAHGCGCLYLLLILNLFEATIAASQTGLSENGSVEPDETYDGTDIHINCIQNAINMMTQYKDLYNIMSYGYMI